MSTPGDGTPPGDDDVEAPQDPSQEASREPVGSVGEEAAKLLGALSDWARDQGTDYAGSASGAAGAFTHALHEIDEHVATGSADCRYCPVCQVIHVVRQTSPEVRTHLAMAAGSLMNAAAGLLATQARNNARPGVEKIDLDDASPWDEER
jgi:hypothetical protein